MTPQQLAHELTPLALEELLDLQLSKLSELEELDSQLGSHCAQARRAGAMVISNRITSIETAISLLKLASQ